MEFFKKIVDYIRPNTSRLIVLAMIAVVAGIVFLSATGAYQLLSNFYVWIVIGVFVLIWFALEIETVAQIWQKIKNGAVNFIYKKRPSRNWRIIIGAVIGFLVGLGVYKIGIYGYLWSSFVGALVLAWLAFWVGYIFSSPVHRKVNRYEIIAEAIRIKKFAKYDDERSDDRNSPRHQLKLFMKYLSDGVIKWLAEKMDNPNDRKGILDKYLVGLYFEVFKVDGSISDIEISVLEKEFKQESSNRQKHISHNDRDEFRKLLEEEEGNRNVDIAFRAELYNTVYQDTLETYKAAPFDLAVFASFHLFYKPEIVLKILVKGALIDGSINHKEYKALTEIHRIFGVEEALYAIVIKEIELRNLLIHAYRLPDAKIKPPCPYSILGVSKEIGDQALQEEYQRLKRELDPFYLISQGVTKDAIDAATRRFKEIDAAYKKICKDRKIPVSSPLFIIKG